MPDSGAAEGPPPVGRSETRPLEVDGARPAVAWITSLPRTWTTPGERLLLLCLAADSYDGTDCRPRPIDLARWTGLLRSSLYEVIGSLERPRKLPDGTTRPALIQRVKDPGQRNLRFVLSGIPGLLSVRDTQTPEPRVSSESPLSVRDARTHPDPYPVGTTPPPTTVRAHEEEEVTLEERVRTALAARGVPADEAAWLWRKLHNDPATRNPMGRLQTAWLEEQRRAYRSTQLHSRERCALCSATREQHRAQAYDDHEFEEPR